MAKPKKKPIGEQPTIMDQFAAYNPPWTDEPGEKSEKDKDGGEVIKTLTERLAKVESEYADFRKQQLYNQFASTQQVVEKQVQPAKTEVSFDNLPDPVVDSKAYTAELLKRINAANDAKLEMVRAEQRVEQERAQLATNLWDGFKASHPAWADHDLLVEAAASKISQGMQARGVNVPQFVKTAPEEFYKEVASYLEKQYPQLKKSEEDDGDIGAGDEDTNRTAGVFGGTPGKHSKGDVVPASSEEDNQAFLRSLAEQRYKAGIR